MTSAVLLAARRAALRLAGRDRSLQQILWADTNERQQEGTVPRIESVQESWYYGNLGLISVGGIYQRIVAPRAPVPWLPQEDEWAATPDFLGFSGLCC
jgi:hypothetical protein